MTPPRQSSTESSLRNKKVVIGICAMAKKATGKPMREIQSRILQFYGDYLEFVVFEERIILEESVIRWPLCDCLISFYSDGFPLNKAIEYAEIRRPFALNDLYRQRDLMDRNKVYEIMERSGIEHPRYKVAFRNRLTTDDEVSEHDDSVTIKREQFVKPFVEKPLDADDHRICIYYPSTVGGGSQQLFRKVGDTSSAYCNISTIRRDGSYLYEDFIAAEGTDIKVYAVGPDYAHAEARKAPALDGRVERDSSGKEIRYPVLLSAADKMIAQNVVLAFGQTVCGFDVLRANGRSYVIDVNGFSFVKSSRKYYEDAAKILGRMILQRMAERFTPRPAILPREQKVPLEYLLTMDRRQMLRLRCVVAIIRHGDRTPKMKVKMEVEDERLYELYVELGGVCEPGETLKLKRPQHLLQPNKQTTVVGTVELTSQFVYSENTTLQVLCLAKTVLAELQPTKGETDDANAILRDQWQRVRDVLERKGHFSGINRKIQLKYLAMSRRCRNCRRSSSSTPSPLSAVVNCGSCCFVPRIFFILKWGGALTEAGALQAEALGKLYRNLYPTSSGSSNRSAGFLRLHSTYQHDLKIYSSDEGRVQMTAAAFAKGMLALEGELPPILIQMVKASRDTDTMLDAGDREYREFAHRQLCTYFKQDREPDDNDHRALNPLNLATVRKALLEIGNPCQFCERLRRLVRSMYLHVKELDAKNAKNGEPEKLKTPLHRWKKLHDSYTRTKSPDVFKIEAMYENLLFDIQRHPEFFCESDAVDYEDMFVCLKSVAGLVAPLVFGIGRDEKVAVAKRIGRNLLSKIRADLHRVANEDDDSSVRLDRRAAMEHNVQNVSRQVLTRLYFTSDSQIHSLVNLIRWGGLAKVSDPKWAHAVDWLSEQDFNYMSQVAFVVYEDRSKSIHSPRRLRTHLLFSPGVRSLDGIHHNPEQAPIATTSATVPVRSTASTSRRTVKTTRFNMNPYAHDSVLLHEGDLISRRVVDARGDWHKPSVIDGTSVASEITKGHYLTDESTQRKEMGQHWPPVRKLELLYDNLKFADVDGFLATALKGECVCHPVE